MKIALVILLLALLIGACSVRKYSETTVIKPNHGILKLVGNSAGRSVLLEGQPLSLDPNKQVNSFELSSGVYQLEVRAQGSVLLSQKLIITTGQINEVKLP